MAAIQGIIKAFQMCRFHLHRVHLSSKVLCLTLSTAEVSSLVLENGSINSDSHSDYSNQNNYEINDCKVDINIEIEINLDITVFIDYKMQMRLDVVI